MPKKGSGTGFGRHEKGYIRCWRRGPNYGRLAHRMVMAELCRVWCYYPLAADGIPAGFDIHHTDTDKAHNCPCNLLLIEHTLHYHADQDRRGANRTTTSMPTMTNFEDIND